MPGGAMGRDSKDRARWGESTVLRRTSSGVQQERLGLAQARGIGGAACWCPGEEDNISKDRAEGGTCVSQHSPPHAVNRS